MNLCINKTLIELYELIYKDKNMKEVGCLNKKPKIFINTQNFCVLVDNTAFEI